MAQLFDKFIYETIPLQKILLDPENPRIVTQKPLKTQAEIIIYLFEHENLSEFISQIVKQGKNKGAENPYVIKIDDSYIVMEGNTRIAAYKLLCGLEHPPKDYEDSIPSVSETFKSKLLVVDCTIAPSRDAMMSIMAHSHFGAGDKTKWGYLGSRKAVYNEHKKGKSITHLARVFEQPASSITDYLLEYNLYLEALKLPFTKNEKSILLNPSVQFNPPVRFLQTSGHKEKVGIEYDRTNLAIKFSGIDAKKKFKHLIYKLVIATNKNKGTDTYEQVFSEYKESSVSPAAKAASGTSAASSATSSAASQGSSSPQPGGSGLKGGALFKYQVKRNNQLLTQLMREAQTINASKLPAAGTFLLRNIVESLLKDIIHDNKLNPNNDQLSLSQCLDRCIGNASKAGISAPNSKVLKDFKNNHLTYLNLGAHGNLIPSYARLMDARNTIDQFVKVHI